MGALRDHLTLAHVEIFAQYDRLFVFHRPDWRHLVQERVARLEANVEHIRADISDVKIDIRRLNDKIDSVDHRPRARPGLVVTDVRRAAGNHGPGFQMDLRRILVLASNRLPTQPFSSERLLFSSRPAWEPPRIRE
jgi:hypothetical protein